MIIKPVFDPFMREYDPRTGALLKTTCQRCGQYQSANNIYCVSCGTKQGAA